MSAIATVTAVASLSHHQLYTQRQPCCHHSKSSSSFYPVDVPFTSRKDTIAICHQQSAIIPSHPVIIFIRIALI